MIRIYAKTTSYDDFVQDMKHIDSLLAPVQPDRETFVRQDEGQDILVTASHSWTIVYHGKMVQTPAVVDSEGNVTTPAVMWDGERADLYLHGNTSQQMYDYLISQGVLQDLPNGSEFVHPNPESPDAILAGESF